MSRGPSWPLHFRKRQKLNQDLEPALSAHPLNIDDDEDAVYSFMAMRQDWRRAGRRDPRAELVQQECAEHERQNSQMRARRGPVTALVGEYAQNRRRMHAQTSATPMTVEMLEECLGPQQYRYRLSGEGLPLSNSTTAARRRRQTATARQASRATIERRTVFVTDLDRQSLLAMARTASPYHYQALQNAFYRYFASAETYIGVNLPTVGVSRFELAFHLPFRALRRLPNKTQPHVAFDVTFLDWEGRNSAYIFPAKYSFVITGTDDWRWMAYCFVDTFFDTDEDAESASYYADPNQSPDGIPLDPCAAGRDAMDNVVQDPREYFLRILEARLACVSDEWLCIVQEIERNVKLYQVCSSPSASTMPLVTD